MSNKIEYIFSLQDRISAKLKGISATSDKTASAISGVRDKMAAADSVMRDTGRSIGSLKMKIDALQAEREWIPADNIAAIREYNREIARLTDELESLETAASGGKFKKWASEAFDSIPGAGLLKNPLVTGMAAIGFAGSQAMNLDEGMAQVNITAQLDEKGLSDLKQRLMDIARENKTDILLAPKGFEQINSQLDDVDLSLSILDASLKGSKAGFTDMETVSSALAQTLSIVGKENTTAMEVLDTFFAAKRVGAGEFGDFARYMPNLIAGASNLGIAYKEVAGIFAYMTGKGQSAERAAVLMENAFSILGRGEVRERMAKAGVDVFDDAGRIRSVVDIFTDLQKVLGGLNDEQKSSVLEKFGLVDKEAKNAFAILTSDIGKLTDSMNEVTASAGETEMALGFSANSVQKSVEVWNKLKNIGVTVGETLLPVISAGLYVADIALTGLSAVLETVTGFLSGWYGLLQEGNPLVVGMTTAVGILTASMAVNAAMTQRAVILAGLKKAADMAQIAATWGLTTAQHALNAAFIASPLGWIALAIGTVATAVTYCWQKFEGFRVAVLGVWGVVKEFGLTLLDSIITPFKQVLSGIGGVCSAIVNLVKGNFKEAADSAKEGFRNIGEGIIGVNPVSMLHNTIKDGNYSQAWEKGKQAGHESWKKAQANNDAVSVSSAMSNIEVPDNTPVAPVPDFSELMASFEKGKKSTGKSFNLPDTPIDLNESNEYTAVTRKLEPVPVSLVPQLQMDKSVPREGKIIDATRTFTNKADDKAQSYDPGETDCLTDIMLNVRKIAAAVLVPLAMAVPPLDMQAKPLDLTFPAIDAPNVAVSTPSVSVPDVTIPQINVPAIEAPSVAVRTPPVAVPDVTVPQINVPAIEAPSVAVSTPPVAVPDVAVPQVSVPAIDVPSVAVNTPPVAVPDVAVPQINVPAIEAPSVAVSTPPVAVPNVAVPQVSVPAIDVPEMSDAYDISNVTETSNTFMNERNQTVNDNGRKVHVAKVCDEIVIHVQNTDHKGADTIRTEIMRILDELAEG